jgi:hypothetical protein
MTDRWLPTDTRQLEIHRLLLLVGGEPAAFFLDACSTGAVPARADPPSRRSAATLAEAHLAAPSL